MKIATAILASLLVIGGVVGTLSSDPCGMVPPIFTGGNAISRIGLQKTYVFYKDGVESFVIRPGFQGKVDEFGMLIPFPTPPELRKVPDDVFAHVSNAIDPPEVVVDLRTRLYSKRDGGGVVAESALQFDAVDTKKKDRVRVLKKEAVGMYEVAVLEAGSAKALKRWMDQHKFKYPEGMDKVTEEYVESGWCFVAVKTKVGQKQGVEPTPGQRAVDANLPSGSVFDGNVQAMGFRFKTDELVVPMRLSAFNGGDTRNVVYLLTDGPRKIRAIPEEYVVRQLTGRKITKNVTELLPLRIIGGTEKDISDWRLKTLPTERDPEPKNGIAKQLFASDLVAVASGELSLQSEEKEKELLRIGEHFALRGGDIDRVNATALAGDRKEWIDRGVKLLDDMTLTVVDGDFPRDVLAKQNLTFAEYRMPNRRNNSETYDATRFGPSEKKVGMRKLGALDYNKIRLAKMADVQKQHRDDSRLAAAATLTVLFLGLGMMITRQKKRKRVAAIVAFAGAILLASSSYAQDKADDLKTIASITEALTNSKTSEAGIEAAAAYADQGKDQRNEIVDALIKVAKSDKELSRRGWTIAALAKIGGQDVDESLLNIHADDKQEGVVRVWAAAARVSMTRTTAGLVEKAQLVQQFPSLGRPIGMRLVESMSKEGDAASVEEVLGVTQKVPQLTQALAPAILAFGEEKLVKTMLTAKNQNVRRMAAGYVGTLHNQGGGADVAKQVCKSLAFDPMANAVPWNKGPLFLPGIQWGKEDARELVGNLIRWHLWSDINSKGDEKQQIHNNIRSVGLARVAGYASPGWNNVGTGQWLKAWGKCMGRGELKKILEEQDSLEKYGGLLDEVEEKK